MCVTFRAGVSDHPNVVCFAVGGSTGDVIGRLAFGRSAGPGRVVLAFDGRWRWGGDGEQDGDFVAVLAAPDDLGLRFAFGPARQRHVVAFVDRHVTGALLVDDVRRNCVANFQSIQPQMMISNL